MQKFSLFILAFFCISLGFAQPKKILFIGNSYTYVNDLPKMLSELALVTGDSLIYDSNTPGGYTFQLHSTNATTLAKINSQKWDYVVLQEQSQLPSFPPSQVATECYPYARKLDSLIHLNNACTQVVFYMTWGRKYGDASNCANYPVICTYDGMQGRLRQSYLEMADANEALVAPAGMAWKASRAADSTLNLWSSDNSHPSVEGSYLTACTFYATLFQKTPVGLPTSGTISQTTATFLQNIAHNTVFDSLSNWNINVFNPVADFTYTVNEHEVTFHNNSTNATNYVWNFGNGATDTLANLIYTYANAGTYQVQLISNNGCGLSDTITQTIVINAGVNIDNQQFNQLNIFPNPANKTLFIEGDFEEIRIIDALGKSELFTHVNQISLEKMPKGIYFVEAKKKGKVWKGKFVKE
jgi:PKD repeat protein